MKLSLISAAPALLLASSAAFAQQAPAAPVAPAPAAVPAPVVVAPAPVAPAPAIDAAAPAPAPLAVAPAEVLPPPVPEIPLPTKLAIGKEGFWQPGALLQFWAFGSNQGGDTATTMRVRRAELRVKGEIVPKLFGFNVMIDPARVLESNSSLALPNGAGNVNVANQGAVTIMQDYMITFMSEYADVSVGQFKIPLSYEGYNGSSKILFPERALVSRRFGDQRDLGIKVEKKLGKIYYQAALFNGDGQNRLDTNAQKDAALRLEVTPVEGVMIGGVGYAGLTNRETSPTKDRLEADFKLDMANFLLQAEYIHGWDGPTAAARTESAGVYATIAYTFMERMQPLFRIGRFDPNVRGNAPGGAQRFAGNVVTPATGLTDEVNTYELGFNYYLRGNDAKLQASWSKYVFADQLNRGEVIVSAQAAF